MEFWQRLLFSYFCVLLLVIVVTEITAFLNSRLPVSSHKICGCSDSCHCPYFAWLDLEKWQCSGAKNWGCSGFLMPALHREGDAGPWSLEEDLTCLQVQGTRKILLLNCGRGESSRKIFSNFINTLKSFLRCTGLSEITYPLEDPWFSLCKHHTTHVSIIPLHPKTHSDLALTIQFNFLQ